jgi:hypothetical protein
MCGRQQTLVLLNYTTTSSQPYTLYTFNITAIGTSMTITFSLVDRNAFWLLDTISVIDVKTREQLIENGDFETGNLNHWNYCNPNSTNNSSRIGQNGTFSAQNGGYFYYGAPQPYPDFLSQAVSTTIGYSYNFSFWLGHAATAYSSNSNNNFIVTVFF